VNEGQAALDDLKSALPFSLPASKEKLQCHIVVETTPGLATILDFWALFSVIHRRIADNDHAVLNDFKSRV
jgi:hypothetical protein